MSKTETNVSNLKINRGTYANIQANISSIGENELIITTDKNVPIPQTTDSGKVIKVNSSGDYELGTDNDTTYSNATTSASGLMSASDKTKLNGIETGAQVNPSSYLKSASSSGNTLTLTKQDNTTTTFTPIVPDSDSDLTNDRYVRFDTNAQSLTSTQQSNARTNLGLGSVATKDTGTSSGNVPVLDSNGKLDTSILPALAITDTFVVNSQASMLALTAQVGDVCVRTDLNKSFILKTAGASTLENWQELLTPTGAVSSVNGKTGAVTLSASDVSALPSSTSYVESASVSGDTLTLTPSSGSNVTFTNTTYESKTASSGGTAVSLVTTGEKYTWNNKGTYSKPSGGIPASDLAESYYLASNPSGYTTNTGTVTSVQVQAGTGLSSSTSTAQSTTLDTTIGVASGYKLPTTSEWSGKQDALTTTSVSDGTINKTIGFDSNGNIVKGTISGGMTNPMTTAGDIIYGGTSGTPTRLAKGSAGQVLTMNSGATAPIWSTPSNYYPIRSYTSGLQISSYNGSTNCQLYVPYATTSQKGVISAGTGLSVSSGVASVSGVSYLTTAPSSANTSGDLKFVVLSSEPATKYSGYLYIITG